jgi:hypothetical protein
VWGLALTLSEALVGGAVVRGDHVTLRAQVFDPRRRPTPAAHGVVTSNAVEQVFERALAVRPSDRYPDAGSFWGALIEAHGKKSAPFPMPSPEIPDLVPIARRPSGAHKVSVGIVQPLDFDGSDQQGPSLALDVAPEDLVRRGSLAPRTPPKPAVSEPAPSTLAGAAVSVQARAGVSSRPPSIAPVGVRISPLPSPAPPVTGTADEPRHRSSRPPPAPSAERKPEPNRRPLALRLVPGLLVAASSIVVTLLARLYAAATSEVFSLGPIKVGTIAAVLLVGGLALAGRELLRER